MSRIRVLVVDDAVVMRRLISSVLENEPDIEVVGVAAHGRLALARIPQVNPDCITLDVEMPEMDGLEALVEIRKTWPKLPVIMFSTLTDRGAVKTLEALARGATDYVTKPANVGSINEATERLRTELAAKVRLHAGRTPVPSPKPVRQASPPVPATQAAARRRPIEAVCIASSTGGPAALASLVPALPATLGVPVFTVQHMPPLFTKLLAERLDQGGGLRVAEGAQDLEVRPGYMYIAPGGKHMEVRRHNGRTWLELNELPPENSCRPAADVLFRSVAAAYGPALIAAVLTGMGQDGMRGAQAIEEAGGEILAQDEATSVVWGMPGAVVHAGIPAQVIALDQIGPSIVRAVERSRTLVKRA